MNEVIKNIQARRSIRFFDDTPVKDEDIQTMLECAKIAPSAMYQQPWHFTVLRDRVLMAEITAVNKEIALASGIPHEVEKAKDPNFDSFRTAKTVIVISAKDDVEYAMGDCANTAMIITLVATSLGLGSCYLAGFNHALRRPEGKDFCARLKVPEGHTPLFAVSLGYTAEQPKVRKPLKPDSVNYIG
ncbi:MAG: nitroreductase family protein [Spirochaetes bacterium]|nr:nitroreductase family protein [Spirochaetota bacterium]